jgi:DUF1680 family protein
MIWQTFVSVTSIAVAAAVGNAPPSSVTPIAAERVVINDSFWGGRQHANRQGTLAANFEQCEKTGRIENFVKAAKGAGTEKYEGYFFNDSDVYKAIEGACLVLERTKDPALDAKLDGLIATIAAAQQPDGYLNAYYTLMEPEKKWTDLPVKHELYCAGHLIEAGIAHHRVTGKRTLLDVAVRFADLIDSMFGPPPKRNGVAGHEEIELALVKLWKHTGEEKYRDLAAHFVAQRGRAEQVGGAGGGETRTLYGEYCQDHAPVETHDHAVGHAVRAMYLYCAVADLAAMTGDATYTPALDRVWDDLTNTKMYITGGIGNSSANEGFTTPYDLPNDSAYAETCAGIGLAMWSHRMALLHGSEGARFMDVVERGLYNGILSGVSQDGRGFFYVNPLGSRGTHHRQAWFACACCPPNILRFVEQVGGMVYATGPAEVLVNLYVGSRAPFEVESAGRRVTGTIEQTTSYPWDGDVKVTLTLDAPAEFALRLRVPGWCRSTMMRLNDGAFEPAREAGYATVRRTWKSGDTVQWSMSMPVERVYSHPSVKGNAGRAAFQRGPMVYCFEGADNPGIAVRQAAIPAGAEVHTDHLPGVLGGVTVLRVKGQIAGGDTGGALYRTADARTVTMTAIPYFAWDNREPGEMLVWMPETLALAEKPLDPTIKASASHVFRNDTVGALYDTKEPSASNDHSIPRLTFWPQKGTAEWVQYDFTAPKRVSGVEVYWFDDSGAGGGCALPESWRVMCKVDGEWVEAAAGTEKPAAPDRFNAVRFPAVTAEAVRLEIKLREGMSAGVLEWRVMQR